jgi:selenocysteine lyase/cysteine desulfurase
MLVKQKEVNDISNLEFSKAKIHFDSASIGTCPTTADGDDSNQAPSEKDPFDWDKEVEVVQSKFGKLLGQPAKTISIFHNTTAAVQRVLLRLSQLFGASEPTLLLTDLEYPGIVSAVDEEWVGRVVMAKLSDLIWTTGGAGITEKLKECILMSRPSVVYLSHIARASGYRIEEHKILDFIRRYLPQTVIVLDGAQACGNIHVTSQILAKVDIYVTSGHKWLCGKQTLGLVYAAEDWRLKDPAQSYSMTRVPTGTGSKDVIVSLLTSLRDFNGELKNQTASNRMRTVEKHNADLAEDFCSKIRKMGSHISHVKNSQWRWNGIATIVFDSPDLIAELRKREQSLKFTSLGNESWREDFGGAPPGNRYLLDPNSKKPFERVNFSRKYVPKIEGYPARFCFHYYHSTADVDRLIFQLKTAHRAVKGRAAIRKSKR